MEFMIYLAPAAFVFSLAAISQITSLKREIEQLKIELEKLKK